MLILSRQCGESIVIDVNGATIKFTPIKIFHGKVRIAFEAPKEVTIDREEVWQRRKVSRQG